VVIGPLLTLTHSDVEASQIRRVTEQVLGDPRYREAEPSVIQRAIMWVIDALARLIGQLRAGDGGTIVGVALMALAIGVTVVIVVVLLRRVRRDAGTAGVTAGIGGRTGGDWRRLAEEAEDAGEWDVALRCRYRALLADLVAAGVTDEVVGRTARDYLRDISDAAPATEQSLTWVTEAFEATWYDRRPVAASDVAAVRTASDDIRRHALVKR
jgi:hypothetical protein